MASTKYGMGQLRFNSGYHYQELVTADGDLAVVYPTSEETSDANSWRDYVMPLNSALSTDATYLLKLSIPKDENYNCNYTVKLVTGDQLTTQTSGYQVVKYLNVPAQGNSQKSSRIILYPVKRDTESNKDYLPWDGLDETPKLDQPRAILAIDWAESAMADSTTIYSAGTVFYNTNNTEYAVVLNDAQVQEWDNNSNLAKIINKNDTVLNWVWDMDDEHNAEVVNFSIIFRPKAAYNKIWIQMIRDSIDWDISDGTSMGRTIDTQNNNFKTELYVLTELTGEGTNVLLPTGLTNIGLHSHPNLLFSINGEEIRVGQSGYYELNDFDITSFNIAVENSEDYFVLDYQYKVTS